MNPPQLRHTDMQCGAETDRRAQPARHRHRHSQALALGRQPPAQPPGMKPPDGSVSFQGHSLLPACPQLPGTGGFRAGCGVIPGAWWGPIL